MSQSSTMTCSPFIAARRPSARVTVVLPSLRVRGRYRNDVGTIGPQRQTGPAVGS